MYLLFLDESGTHGDSPCMIVGGIAVHESDAWHLQQSLETFLMRMLNNHGLDSTDFELHATDIKNGNKDWAGIDAGLRFAVLRATFKVIRDFVPMDPSHPPACFAAVVDRDKVGEARAREKQCYELVLKKFDDMLRNISSQAGEARQQGLVIHDQKVREKHVRQWTDERRIQEWTQDWREAAGGLGRLRYFADVPLFADSQASRLIQAADFVTYSVWRYYGLASRDPQFLDYLWDRFAHHPGAMRGLIHVNRGFARRSCDCRPCQTRFKAEDQQLFKASP